MSTESKGPLNALFSIEKIVKKKVDAQGIRKYKIRWIGFSSSEDTWNTEEDLRADGFGDILDNYLNEHGGSPFPNSMEESSEEGIDKLQPSNTYITEGSSASNNSKEEIEIDEASQDANGSNDDIEIEEDDSNEDAKPKGKQGKAKRKNDKAIATILKSRGDSQEFLVLYSKTSNGQNISWLSREEIVKRGFGPFIEEFKKRSELKNRKRKSEYTNNSQNKRQKKGEYQNIDGLNLVQFRTRGELKGHIVEVLGAKKIDDTLFYYCLKGKLFCLVAADVFLASEDKLTVPLIKFLQSKMYFRADLTKKDK